MTGISSSRRDFGAAGAAVFTGALLMLALFVVMPEPNGPALPELASLEPDQKKSAFFEFLRPVVVEVNASVRRDRARLGAIADALTAGRALTWHERRMLRRLAARYEVDLDGASLNDEVIPTLERRIDTVPPALALVQAAKESGWGTSRFAIEGNNLYGQRCYEAGCGIRPKGRPNARFGLARFDSVAESVASYIRNLNTHPRYRAFRELRQRLRAAGERPTALELAEGLDDYSERGAPYVAEIKSLIRQNELEPGP